MDEKTDDVTTDASPPVTSVEETAEESTPQEHSCPQCSETVERVSALESVVNALTESAGDAVSAETFEDETPVRPHWLFR